MLPQEEMKSMGDGLLSVGEAVSRVGGKGCPLRATRTRVDRSSERTGVPLGSGGLGVGATSAKGNKRGTQTGNTSTKDVP